MAHRIGGDPEPFEVHPDGLPVPADPERVAAREPAEVVISRFADELRQGGSPRAEEFSGSEDAGLAAQLRELLPLVADLERWKVEQEIESLRRNVPSEFSLSRLGKYNILREVGRGGMGVVFEAVEAETGRRVALKLLPWRVAGDRHRGQERLRSEAATIAGLRHAHIVPVYSFHQSDGYCYYVMQFVDGLSLDRAIDALRDNRLEPAGLRPDDWTRFARIGFQVALALDHAHGRNVLHNDVKPANLILDGRGRVVVTDFGIARPLAGETAPGGSYAPPGTLRYMAPERLRGRCDARSDVYALGATLYELLTRAPAFPAREPRALLEQIIHTRPLRPRRLDRRIPRPLERIVLAAMARHPDDRYPHARSLAADLQRFMNGEKVQARRPGWLVGALRAWRRRSDSRLA